MVELAPGIICRLHKTIPRKKGFPVKRLIAPLVFALSLVAFVAADDKKADKFDAAKMVGDWTIVEGVRAGEKVGEDHLQVKVTATKETFILDGPAGKFVMGYKLDTKASPVGIDMEIKEGPIQEGKAIGIVWVKGDEMKLCYIPMADGTRPAKFESTKDNGAFFFTMKRKAK
jgi:uncharacterized protein (TIGR03067 family)